MTASYLSATLSAFGIAPSPSLQLGLGLWAGTAHDNLPQAKHFMSPAMHSSSSSSVPPRRLHPSALERLRNCLTSREQAVLGVLATLHAVTTEQVARLAFAEHEVQTSTRLARRHLQRLTDFGLVRRFADRSRDRKVGAPGHIHALTNAGLRLTGAAYGVGARQRKAYRPSQDFLAHRLAISELCVRLKEQERGHGPAVREFEAEPDCRRTYTGPAGERLVIKPDALVRLGVGETEVSWFVEIELDPDRRPSTIATKCRAYRQYEMSGQEQREHGVFPGVIFIVPTPEQQRAVALVIGRQPADAQGLFAVATEDEALTVMTEAEVPV